MKPTLIETDFNTLTKAQKRVAIAKDVIARIHAENLVENRGELIKNLYDVSTTKSLKDEINNHKCEVCARGAILCSWIGNFNKITEDDIRECVRCFRSNDFPAEILDVFDREMLDNIEAAFENQTYDWHYDECETERYVNAFSTYDEEKNDYVSASIIEIMEHLIKHEGEFPLPE